MDFVEGGRPGDQDAVVAIANRHAAADINADVVARDDIAGSIGAEDDDPVLAVARDDVAIDDVFAGTIDDLDAAQAVA